MSHYLAYKFVIAALLIAEANYVETQLDLLDHGVDTNNIREMVIYPPTGCFGCRVDTDRYEFDFIDCGLLRNKFGEPGRRYVTRLDDRSGVWRRAMDNPTRNMETAEQKSKFSTNGAYQLATNFLRRLTVDVDRLEKSFPHTVSQRFYHDKSDSSMQGEKLLLPVFDVQWGGAVKVTLNGVTSELLALRQEDDSYSAHPAVFISADAAANLMSISDEDFTNYSLSQKSNLVGEYSADCHNPMTIKSNLTRQPWRASPADGATNNNSTIQTDMSVETISIACMGVSLLGIGLFVRKKPSERFIFSAGGIGLLILAGLGSYFHIFD